MFGGCLGGVGGMFGGWGMFAEMFWGMFGGCWGMFGGCLGDDWGMFGGCFGAFFFFFRKLEISKKQNIFVEIFR